MKIQIVCSLLGMLCGSPASTNYLIDCPQGAKSNPYDMSVCGGNSCTVEKLVEISPGKCKWIVDETATKKDQEWRAQLEKDRQDLLWAARTRPLMDAEMQELRLLGESILTPDNVPYSPEEVNREYNDLLLHQYEMREIAAHNKAR